MSESELQTLMDWMRAQPRASQELMLQFPPMCFVRAKPVFRLNVPSPGGVGQVVQYAEHPQHGLCCIVRNESGEGFCAPSWLELDECHDGMTSEFVDMVCFTRAAA